MSLVAISGNASGTGTLTIAAPNTNSNYTLTLPQTAILHQVRFTPTVAGYYQINSSVSVGWNAISLFKY
jgi:hypothetical protein